MATFDGDLNGSNNAYKIRLELIQTSQNQSANTSLVTWRVYLVSTNNAYPSWYLDADNSWSANVAGSGSSGSFGFDFRPASSSKSILIGSGTRTVTHNSSGYATVSGSASVNTAHGSVGDGSVSGSLILTRIPKPPTAPGTPSTGTETTTSVPLSWAAPSNNNGASIEGYQVQRATNSGFSSGTANTDAASTSITVGSLSPGTNYWFRVRAENSAGFGSYSAAVATATLPAAPTSLGSSSEDPTSFTLGWTAPSGNGITEYEIQQSTSASFSSGVTTWTQSGTSRAISGLAPATTYHYRVRAQTLGGVGAWSSTFSITPGLPAPTLGTIQTNATSWLLTVNWTAPSITTGLTGYRVEASTSSGFDTTVYRKDVANVLTTELSIPGGRLYYVRVAALTAGGVNEWSTTKTAVHQLNAGNLDGWTRVGTKPSQITYYTSQGIRRSTVGGTQALYVESLATSAVTLSADTFGIQKTFTNLEVGAAYRFEARATLVGAPLANSYRLSVVSESSSAAVDVETGTELPYVEFIADAATVTIRIMLAESVPVAGVEDEVERVAFHGITLQKMSTDYPQRLRGTVYETDLANHFDLACNSVGAAWYVDRRGETRFTLPGEALPVAYVFSDEDVEGALHYVDVTSAYSTAATVNRLEVTNYGWDSVGDVEANDSLVVENAESVNKYGTRTERMDVNLYDQVPYQDALSDRLADVLDVYDQPQLLISSVTWNAQEDRAVANALEVGQRIAVTFNGTTQDSQIVSLEHRITPTRWLIVIQLLKIT